MPETNDPQCPSNCPNRRGDGLNVFGLHLDPFELMLQAGIVLLLMIPAARASAKPDFGIDEALKWLGAIGGSCTLVRMSPTDRINAYIALSKPS